MGQFGFTPEAGRHYRLVDDVTGQAWDLPEASSDGATLQVRRVGDRFAVRVINRTGGRVGLQAIQAGKRIPLGEMEDVSRLLTLFLSVLSITI